MATNYHRVKKDVNHKELVDLLRAYGCYVIDCAPLKGAFDLIVVYLGEVMIVEIKSENGKLSERELFCKVNVEKHGVKYHIIRNSEDVRELLCLN
jgi:hypothetical protein